MDIPKRSPIRHKHSVARQLIACNQREGGVKLPVQSIVRHDSRTATIRAGLLFVANLGPYTRQSDQPARAVGADVLAEVAQIIMQLAPLGRLRCNRLPGNGYP